VAALYKERGFKLPRIVDISNWYLGFNMLDPVIGKGDTPEQQIKNKKLRQAVSIAIDWEEGYGKVFPKKAGEAAHGPLPGGLFGSRHGTPEGHNPVTHRLVNGKVERRPISDAKKLLAEAGYPGGRDAKTGKPLVLNYDYQRQPTAELKAELDWMVKQFAKIDVQLDIRATDFNQYQEKTLKGKQQITWGGWLADYPDPENFLFLLYGPNSKAKHEGENVVNYESDAFDKLYKQMASMEDGPERGRIIDEMVAIAREDSPWAWGYFPYASVAYQSWLTNGKPSILIRDYVQYWRVDPKARVAAQSAWNQARHLPLVLLVLALAGLVWVGRRAYKAREQSVALAALKA
jgi:ABC-type transport system substrate-binding protein